MSIDPTIASAIESAAAHAIATDAALAPIAAIADTASAIVSGIPAIHIRPECIAAACAAIAECIPADAAPAARIVIAAAWDAVAAAASAGMEEADEAMEHAEYATGHDDAAYDVYRRIGGTIDAAADTAAAIRAIDAI